jgi:hypothetical protein
MAETTVWTMEDVALRLEESMRTSKRLPSVRVQGYFNTWPTIVQEQWQVMAAGDERPFRFPPTPKDIDRMLQTMRWMQWLEVDERHLLWMRSDHEPWRRICARLGCDRSTAWRRWQRALQTVADQLNAAKVGTVCRLA